MQAAIYRRNYYLIRSGSGEKLLKDDSRQRQIYSETARVINEMIMHIKSLMARVNALREELESLDSDEEESDVEDLIDGFKQFQKAIPLTFFAKYPLDNKMLGPLVLRLTKEIAIWNKWLPFLLPIAKEVEEIFAEQQKSEAQNISLVYFMTVKKITAESNEYFRKARLKRARTEKTLPSKQGILLVPAYLAISTRDSDKREKELMEDHMRDLIRRLYRNLEVDAFEAVEGYLAELSEKDNLELAAKRQEKRNKRAKKEIKQFKQQHQQYLAKREIYERRRKLRQVSNSRIFLSLPKNPTHLAGNPQPKVKSLPKSDKLTLPSLKLEERKANLRSKLQEKMSNKENPSKGSKSKYEAKFDVLKGKFEVLKGKVRLKL